MLDPHLSYSRVLLILRNTQSILYSSRCQADHQASQIVLLIPMNLALTVRCRACFSFVPNNCTFLFVFCLCFFVCASQIMLLIPMNIAHTSRCRACFSFVPNYSHVSCQKVWLHLSNEGLVHALKSTADCLALFLKFVRHNEYTKPMKMGVSCVRQETTGK